MSRRRGAFCSLIAALTVALWAGFPGAAHAATTNFYVDPVNGNDGNSGTSTAAAFRTIGQAQTAVRGINGSMSGDVVVNLRGGAYPVTSTLSFGTTDSGFNGYRVIWQGYNGETPVLDGGRHLTGWAAVGNGQYKASTGGLNFRQLYVNGGRATRARYPDVGDEFDIKNVDNGNQQVGVLAAYVAGWSNFTQVEMVVQNNWAESYLRLASSSAGSLTNLAFQQAEASIVFNRPYPPLATGQPFHFENAYEFLNLPGEFYVNTGTQTVYYLPRAGENMSSVDVVAPATQTLVQMQGNAVNDVVHDVLFRGITFANTTWMRPSTNGYANAQGGLYNLSANMQNQQYVDRPPAAVAVAYADRVYVDNNVFTRIGSTALDFNNAVYDSTAIGNVITGVAGNGIMVGKFSDPTVEYHTVYNPPSSPSGESPLQVSVRNTIADNLITGYGLDYYGTAGINAGFVANTQIIHNDVSDGHWAGISLGWGWQSQTNALGSNTVNNNEVHNVVNMLCDTGGIYHLSNDPGTTISYNYVHDVTRSSTACTSAIAGIYLDEGSANMTVANNVVSNTDQSVFTNTGGSNTIYGTTTANTSIQADAGLEPSWGGLRTLANLAAGRPTSASSQWDSGFGPGNAADNNYSTGWSPSGTDTSPWWQVDLGAAYQLGQWSLTTRQDGDQPATRHNFMVIASNDPNFGSYAVIGRQDSRTLPNAAITTADVLSTAPYRYVRVAKTDGGYFFITDFRVMRAGSSTAADASPSVNPSTYYKIKNVNSGKVLNNGGSTADGAGVSQWSDVTSTNLQWQIQQVYGNLFRIVNRTSGKALDVNNFSHVEGLTLDQWSVNDGNNQLWYFEPAGSGSWYIHSFESKQVLDVYSGSTADGAAIEQWTVSSGTNQQWSIG